MSDESDFYNDEVVEEISGNSSDDMLDIKPVEKTVKKAVKKVAVSPPPMKKPHTAYADFDSESESEEEKPKKKSGKKTFVEESADDDDDIVYEPTKKMQPIKITEGSEKKNTISTNMCEFCGLYYPQNMISKKINNDCLDNQCMHCLYWMNYDEQTRLEFDKLYTQHGMGIAKYILDCSSNHNPETCIRGNIGCFLCDYYLKIEIVNILEGHLVNASAHIQVTKPAVKTIAKPITQTDDEDRDVVFRNDLCIDLENIKPIMHIEL